MRRLAIAAAVSLLPSHAAAQISTITLQWADSFDDKGISIEQGGGRLYDGKLEGSDHVIETDPLLSNENSSVAAMLNVEGIDDLSVGINLFKCAAPCKWRVVFAEFGEQNSRSVGSICQSNPRSLEGQFKKYFFCRKAHGSFVMAGGACWPEALKALTGWFDAAYKLHEGTLKGGIGFIARDVDVEATVRDALQTCSDLEASVGRRKGYFNGMIRNLDLAILQQTQRIEKALNSANPDDARIVAKQVVQNVEAVAPIRDSISFKDASYIESIINRALPSDTSFSLR